LIKLQEFIIPKNRKVQLMEKIKELIIFFTFH
jgi:hypothetical protein